MPRLRDFDLRTIDGVAAWAAWRSRVAAWEVRRGNGAATLPAWFFEWSNFHDESDKLGYWPWDKRYFRSAWQGSRVWRSPYGWETSRWAIAHYELHKGE